ncbi:hypothetical protein F5Y15DRAFT_411642 [Xylariaceae sp. FL0016]|nr:hypothetical protein F5Y15DRAFT_411642 [Xylariaceae sp. FL0016]
MSLTLTDAVVWASDMPSTQINADDISMIEKIPTELIIHLMESMTPSALSQFAFTNKRHFRIFMMNQASIMTTILLRLPEIEPFLYLYTATEAEIEKPSRMLHPRTITFTPEFEGAKKTTLIQSRVAFADGVLVCPKKIALTIYDFYHIWNFAKCVDWWADMYPSLRWRENPEDRRCLYSHEESRLRKAIARWWLYSHYFHGMFSRDTNAPKKWENDKRLLHFRILTTSEIREVEDLWGVIYDTVSKDLCSSPERGPLGVELKGWGAEDGRHSTIVNTYMKLDPLQLMYHLQAFQQRRKTDIINSVWSMCKQFTFDRETLSMAIDTVLEERVVLSPMSVSRPPQMGIVDEDRASAQVCKAWSYDAWLSGKPPISDVQKNAFPLQYTKKIGWGDDGRDAVGRF